MKRLKVKTIKYEHYLTAKNSQNQNPYREFDDKVNEFLLTLDAEKIYQISYLNSSAPNSGDDGQHANTILLAIITYFEELK